MKIAIVDDEEKYIEEIKCLINECGKDHDINCFTSGEEFLLEETNDYNIIFLDIEIGSLNGVQIGQYIRECGSEAVIFYVTNHGSYISDALRNAPYQYFIKPIKRDVFIKDFNTAVDKVIKSHSKLMTVWKGEHRSIQVGIIVYIEYAARRLNFYLSTRERMQSFGKISDMQRKLSDYDFVTCHKSYMVNMNHIVDINKIDIIMIDGSHVPMSKAHRANVKDKYNFYLARVTI